MSKLTLDELMEKIDEVGFNNLVDFHLTACEITAQEFSDMLSDASEIYTSEIYTSLCGREIKVIEIEMPGDPVFARFVAAFDEENVGL